VKERLCWINTITHIKGGFEKGASRGHSREKKGEGPRGNMTTASAVTTKRRKREKETFDLKEEDPR